ncbi:cysteine--tRNA ligase [Marinibacterium profundimaris]|uniref:Cysteine--tRNA ligase n=1 Tax=Marinibacterium profundimaris TaxID=1679460 RepID=A0A225NM55_9RHOB|nr:cysteine--tRNA ligase [Marinibacterium profundimaris]OWU74654.1 cysteinyl-tRNA synthetase [Marinibacterium profundimaris]
MGMIRFHNTKTRQKEVFAPIDPENVRLYVCGPTVYDRAHLGNARPVVVFDTLYRLLRQVYGPDHVTYVRNFTDVDDKINARAAASGRPISEITEETIGWYLDDMGALGALQPDHMPRATAYIPQMIAMIEGLIASGHAYAAEGHVLFSVESYADYGALSGRSVDDMIAGARVEVAPYKKNPMDFVLWKPSSDDLPGWDSPWGRGRPGWHIECSAMSDALLGDHFDIHGGGNDLMFPHHENEIAQSCCAHPGAGFANVWLHNEMLQVEGKKMSKSLGNFFTVRDLLDQGIPGEVVRFVLLSTHYRKPMDWTAKKVDEAKVVLDRWRKAQEAAEGSFLRHELDPSEQSPAVLDSLCDDLNTFNARRGLDLLAKRVLDASVSADDWKVAAKQFLNGLDLMGFDELLTNAASVDTLNAAEVLTGLKERLGTVRETAMATKDFTEVDRLKAALVAAGVEVRMSKAGVELVPGPGFDAAKLEEIG